MHFVVDGFVGVGAVEHQVGWGLSGICLWMGTADETAIGTPRLSTYALLPTDKRQTPATDEKLSPNKAQEDLARHRWDLAWLRRGLAKGDMIAGSYCKMQRVRGLLKIAEPKQNQTHGCMLTKLQ